jgi:hypothetical protein
MCINKGLVVIEGRFGKWYLFGYYTQTFGYYTQSLDFTKTIFSDIFPATTKQLFFSSFFLEKKARKNGC